MTKKFSWLVIAAAIAGTLLSMPGLMRAQNPAGAAPGSSDAAAVLGLQIHHATISVANIQAEAAWYQKTLGFSFPAGTGINKIMAKMQACRMTIPGFQLDLIQYDGSQRPPTPSPVFMQQGYVHLVFSVADMNKAYEYLKAAGADVPASVRPGQGMMIHDPEGNEIELTTR